MVTPPKARKDSGDGEKKGWHESAEDGEDSCVSELMVWLGAALDVTGIVSQHKHVI